MPSFDKAFEIFATWQTALFCLGVYMLTYVVRTIVEAFWKGAKQNVLWNELGLHLGPIGTGLIIALVAKKFPWPEPLGESGAARMFYGLICGGASGWVYGRFRAWLNIAADSQSAMASKIAQRLGGKTSDPPPPAAAGKAEELPPDEAQGK
jgi:hypothetical protein